MGRTKVHRPFRAYLKHREIIKQFTSLNRQLDGLFRCNSDNLRNKASVETEESLVLDHLPETVEAVPIHHLVHRRRQTLVLHSGLHKVDGIHRRRSNSCSTEHKREVSWPFGELRVATSLGEKKSQGLFKDIQVRFQNLFWRRFTAMWAY